MAKGLGHKYNEQGEGQAESAHSYPGGCSGEHDPWGGQPEVGPQEHGPPSPSHGAAGGTAREFPWRGNPEPHKGTGAASGSPLDPPIA
jgi:hypothetical protein